MNPTLTNYLLKRYQEMYSLYYTVTKPFHAIKFGFECGDGWFYILRNLSEKIYLYLIRKGKKHLDYFKVTQVKEKYGSLRYYYFGGDEQISKWVNEAEKASETICEQCGSKGKTRGKGWYTTLCLRHWKEYQKTLK